MGYQQDELDREERMRLAQGRPVHATDERDSAEIKQDIRRTRGAMDSTLDELGERLSPRHLIDDVMDVFRSPSSKDTAKRAGDAVSDFANNLGRQVRDNPIGATLVGAGLAWLTFGNSSNGSRQDSRPDLDGDVDFDRYGHESYDNDCASKSVLGQLSGSTSTLASAAGDSAGNAWGSTKDSASSVASSITDAASATGEAVSDAASSVIDGVKSTASSVAGGASAAGSATSQAARRAYLQSRAAGRDAYRETARSARSGARSASQTASDQLSDAYSATSRRVQRAHDEAPLALGLGIMALGAIAGALIPRTRREDELMGEASDDVISEAREQAEQAYERGQSAVSHTVDAAKESAESRGLTGDSLAERATRVVEKTASSISDAAKAEGLHPKQLKDDAMSVAEKTTRQAKSEAKSVAEDANDEAANVDSDASQAIDEK